MRCIIIIIIIIIVIPDPIRKNLMLWATKNIFLGGSRTRPGRAAD
jgi:hypothetical protein